MIFLAAEYFYKINHLNFNYVIKLKHKHLYLCHMALSFVL